MKRLIAAITLISVGLFQASSVVAQTTTVNHLTLNQWVQSTDTGSLKGRVVLPQPNGQAKAVNDVTVAILGRNGDVMTAKSDAKGEFEIAGVGPGVYAMTARADNIFACCAMHVIDSSSASNGKFPQSAEISVANVDYTVVNTAVIRYMPPGVETDIFTIAEAQLDQLSERVCGDDLFRVAQSNGGMKGHLHVAGAKGADLQGANLTNVFIFKGGMEIARTLTDEQGSFEIEKMDAGQYSLLAVGSGGLGLIGFELVDEAELETAQIGASENGRLVGLRHQGGGCCCQEFAMQMAPMPEVVSCVEEVIVTEIVIDECGCGTGCGLCEGEIIEGEVVMDGFGSPVAGGGYYGGGGGGYSGGGGGGGGGLGGIAALAGIGGIIAASSSNDNNAILPPVIASPAIPAN